MHRVSESRSHLLFVLRHWSQAKIGVNDQDEDRSGGHKLGLTSGASPLPRACIVIGNIRI